MILETLVLGSLEHVIGGYVTEYVTKKSKALSRDEVITTIQSEIDRRDNITDEVAALRIAIRELNLLVQRDPALQWRDDQLIVSAGRTGILKRPVSDPSRVLDGLHASVEERRRELSLPTQSDLELIKSDPEMTTEEDRNLKSSENKSQPEGEPTTATSIENDSALIPAPDLSEFQGTLPESEVGTDWTKHVAELKLQVNRERNEREL